MISDIILIGPAHDKKTAVAKRLAEQLNRSHIRPNDLFADAPENLGFSEERDKQILTQGGLLAQALYRQLFIPNLIEQALTEYSGIFDFDAHEILSLSLAGERSVKQTLISYPNVIMLLPWEKSESGVTGENTGSHLDLFAFDQRLVDSWSHSGAISYTVYTAKKSASRIAGEILGLLGDLYEVTVTEWLFSHPHWPNLEQMITTMDQTDRAQFRADWHLNTHMLVAHYDGRIAGFLRYALQEVGVAENGIPDQLSGHTLIETDLIAFGVDPRFRRRGIGRALVNEFILRSQLHQCHQIRFQNGTRNRPAQQLLLKRGFALQPRRRTDPATRGDCLLLPL